MKEIKAEVMGVVSKVLVKNGQVVYSGDQIMILESMKTEAPVVAKADIIIQDVMVDEQQLIEEGDVLVRYTESISQNN